MMRTYIKIIVICIAASCISADDDINEAKMDGTNHVFTCDNAQYPMYRESPYVLPYTVGTEYRVDLNQCSGSYHGPGQPDQFAVDFAMPLGTEITASADGEVVFVEESGTDFGFPNNLVIVQSRNLFIQYMHLTQDGALVEVGDTVTKGQAIAESGATGFAGYPHLHFVITTGGYEYPYDSVPHNFSNTTANVRGPEMGVMYMAEPY